MYVCPMPMLHLHERLSLAINPAIQPVRLRLRQSQTPRPRPTPEGRRNRMIITAPFLVAAMARRRLLSVGPWVCLRPLFRSSESDSSPSILRTLPPNPTLVLVL